MTLSHGNAQKGRRCTAKDAILYATFFAFSPKYFYKEINNVEESIEGAAINFCNPIF
jgi:hypothetical protein